MIFIVMVNDGVNGRLPFAMEANPGGRNRPGETFNQYEVRMEYHEGVIRPNYPVPALCLEVEITPAGVESPFRNSIIIWQGLLCDDCGGYRKNIACIWVFNYDEGVYVDGDTITAGVQKWKEGV